MKRIMRLVDIVGKDGNKYGKKEKFLSIEECVLQNLKQREDIDKTPIEILEDKVEILTSMISVIFERAGTIKMAKDILPNEEGLLVEIDPNNLNKRKIIVTKNDILEKIEELKALKKKSLSEGASEEDGIDSWDWSYTYKVIISGCDGLDYEKKELYIGIIDSLYGV